MMVNMWIEPGGAIHKVDTHLDFVASARLNDPDADEQDLVEEGDIMILEGWIRVMDAPPREVGFQGTLKALTKHQRTIEDIVNDFAKRGRRDVYVDVIRETPVVEGHIKSFSFTSEDALSEGFIKSLMTERRMEGIGLDELRRRPVRVCRYVRRRR